jgi:hypothetical protein
MAGLLDAAFTAPAQSQPATVQVAGNQDQPVVTPASTGFVHRAAQALASLSPVPRAEAATLHHRKSGPRDGWSIQVGAYAQPAQAQKAGEKTVTRLSAAHGKPVVVVAPGDRDKFYLTRIGHFSQAQAQRACRDLHRQHKDCAVLPPHLQLAAR